MTNLFFNGCGGLHSYVFGVCAALQDNICEDIENGKIKFTTISASACAVGCLKSKRNMNYNHTLWRVRHRYYSSRYGMYGWYNMLYKHNSIEIDQNNVKSFQLNNHIQCCTFNSTNIYDTNDIQNTDIPGLYTSSSFIIGLDLSSGFHWKCQNQRLFDGCYHQHKPTDNMNIDVLTLLDYKSLKIHKYNILYWFCIGLMDTNTDFMYIAGYDDAVNILLPLLTNRTIFNTSQRIPIHEMYIVDEINIMKLTDTSFCSILLKFTNYLFSPFVCLLFKLVLAIHHTLLIHCEYYKNLL